MDQSVEHSAFYVETPHDPIEVPGVIVFVPSPDSPSEQIRNLDEARRRRVHEQGHLGKVAQVSPSRALVAKIPGQSLQRLFVVRLVHDHETTVLLALAVPLPCKEQVEAVADLLEGTLDRASSGDTACLSTTTAKATTPRFAFFNRSRPPSIAASRSGRSMVPFHGAFFPLAMTLACSSTSWTGPTPSPETN